MNRVLLLRQSMRTFVLALVLSVLAVLVPASLPTGTPLAEPALASTRTPLKILTIGDSITQGMSGDWTWRYRLYGMLTAQGRPVDMVGMTKGVADPVTTSKNLDYANPNFDADHAGNGGMRISAMRYDVSQIVSATQPDLVLLALGINDLAGGVRPKTVADLTYQMVLDIRRAKPGVHIVVSHQATTWVPGVTEYNQRVSAHAANLNRPSQRVVINPVPANYRHQQDTWDKYHPNAIGEMKIAHQMLRTLASMGYADQPRPINTWPAAGPPRRLEAVRSVATRGKINLAWTNPRGVTNVRVYLRDVTARTPARQVQVVERQGKTSISGLVSGRIYEVTLLPGRGFAASGWSYASTVAIRVP